MTLLVINLYASLKGKGQKRTVHSNGSPRKPPTAMIIVQCPSTSKKSVIDDRVKKNCQQLHISECQIRNLCRQVVVIPKEIDLHILKAKGKKRHEGNNSKIKTANYNIIFVSSVMSRAFMYLWCKGLFECIQNLISKKYESKRLANSILLCPILLISSSH